MTPQEERVQKELIKKLQVKRKSKIFCYINSDRRSFPNVPGINTKLATEAQPFIYEHLKKTGKVDKIDLLLYTRGGITDSVLPLVNLFRNYCKEFNVLVPYLAQSAGTLICLGADNVIMGEMGELSPIDPTTVNQFNPRLIPDNPKSPQIGISVEDVTSFIELAKDEKVGIKEGTPEMLSVFQLLSSKVHPLALGNVYRVYLQIHSIAKKLLEMNPKKLGSSKLKQKEIIETFVKKLYSHNYSINYKEASIILGKKFLLKAKKPEEKLMGDLLESYVDELEIRKAFNLSSYMEDMEDEEEKHLEFIGAYLESESLTHCFKTKLKITQRQDFPPNMHIQIQPGQDIPSVPGYPKSFNIEMLYQNWEEV